MTLEDFFTLTEMKHGLVTTARVDAMILVMQKQRDCASTNVGDAARQWSTAASSLASTENPECLNHFVHLNGLSYLNHWLQEALKCNRDLSDCEELTKTLLGSLEKFSTDQEKLSASGLFITLEKLISHENIIIRERAQMLIEKWKNEKINSGTRQAMETGSSGPVDNSKRSSDTVSVEDKHVDQDSDSCSHQIADEEGNCKVESGVTENFSDRNADNLQLGVTDDDAKESIRHQTSSGCFLNEDEKCTFIAIPILGSKASCQEIFFHKEESSKVPGAKSFTATFASPGVQVKDNDQCATSAYDVKAELKAGKAGSREYRNSFSALSSSDLPLSSPSKNRTVVRTASCNLESKEGKVNISDTETLYRCSSIEQGRPEYSKTMEDLQSGESDLKSIKDLLLKGSPWEKEAAESTDDEKDHCNVLNLKACNGIDTLASSDPAIISNINVAGEMEKSNSELESGEIDALEVARQVAIEVEREVVDYREELCSSPEVSSKEVIDTASPGIVEEKQDLSLVGGVNGNPVVPIKDGSEIASFSESNDHQFSDVVTDPRKDERGLLSPNTTIIVQESSVKTGKVKCEFDLNEDACIDDLDYALNPNHSNNLVNLSAPIAVSASKVSPRFPITPLHFEGKLGWRRSAATSAFRPASPRRALDGEKMHSGSKRKENLIAMDLNVAQTESDLLEGPASIKELPFSSAITSLDSSAEVSSVRGGKRIKLDLNCVGEEEPAFQSSLIRNCHQKGDQGLSTASSSYSRQPSPRNFDLNDNPCLFDAVSRKINIPNATSIYGVKVDDPAITIMGSRMERKAHTDRSHLSYMENISSLPCAPQVPPPGYVYHGLMPIQSHYGRGTNVVPQILGSNGLSGAPFSTSPFLMSLTTTPPNSSVTRLGLDLNFSMKPMESGNRESCTLKNSLVAGYDSLTEEQMRTPSPQVVSSGLSVVRKEPDCSLDPYNYGYKQLASWH